MQDSPKPDSPAQVSFSPVQLHGVLVRVLDTGVLLIGESGIGKSECALDLVRRGHQLVADDVVEVSMTENGLLGRPLPLTFELLEIRGLGIINVRELFGEGRVCAESGMDLCIELRPWSEVERLGNVIYDHDVGGQSIPKFILPVSSGRNLATLVETAVRIFLNRDSGTNASDVLVAKHTELLNSLQ